MPIGLCSRYSRFKPFQGAEKEVEAEMELEGVPGRWWRFGRYEVDDGVIKPAIGASLEVYNPWESHRMGTGRRVRQPPYCHLATWRGADRSTL